VSHLHEGMHEFKNCAILFKIFHRSNLSLGVTESRHHQDLACFDIKSGLMNYSAPISAGNMFQDLPQLCETTDNTKRYT
jgi:hypothetical protein